jgi:hypothetical protein
MEINFHDMIGIQAESSFGEKTSWLELHVMERNAITKRTTKTTMVFYTVDKDHLLCAKLAQAINQCFAETEAKPMETPDEAA